MSALPRGGAAKGRHRDDRAASGQSKQAAHARSAKVKPLHATLARRALLRLDSMAAPDPHSMGVPRPHFRAKLSDKSCAYVTDKICLLGSCPSNQAGKATD